MKKGFTIVELLMVIGIIAVLMGIITTAASSSLRTSRGQRATALCALVQQGLATYHAQKGEWPVSIGSNAQEDQNGEQNVVVLTPDQVTRCVKALVDETKKGNPMMDISGLFVSRSSAQPKEVPCNCGCNGKKYLPAGGNGMDFMSAVRGTKKSPIKMSTSEMHFGYPHTDTGMFMPFRMEYSIPADSLTVKTWH